MMIEEPKMTRGERRRRKRGIFPCMGNDCNKRIKLKYTEGGYCRKCAAKYKALATKGNIPPPVSAHIGGVTF